MAVMLELALVAWLAAVQLLLALLFAFECGEAWRCGLRLRVVLNGAELEAVLQAGSEGRRQWLLQLLVLTAL